jgi:hypothetical protein
MEPWARRAARRPRRQAAGRGGRGTRDTRSSAAAAAGRAAAASGWSAAARRGRGREDQTWCRGRLLEQLEQGVGRLRAGLLRDERLGVPDDEHLPGAHGRAGGERAAGRARGRGRCRRSRPGTVGRSGSAAAGGQLRGARFLQRLAEAVGRRALRPGQREEPVEVGVLEADARRQAWQAPHGQLRAGSHSRAAGRARGRAAACRRPAGRGRAGELGSWPARAAPSQARSSSCPSTGGRLTAGGRRRGSAARLSGSTGSMVPSRGTRTWNSMCGPSAVCSPPTVPTTWPAATCWPTCTLMLRRYRYSVR